MTLALALLTTPAFASDAWWFFVDCHEHFLLKTNTKDNVKIEIARGTSVLYTDTIDMIDQKDGDDTLDPPTCPFIIGGSPFGGWLGNVTLGKRSSAYKDVVIRLRATGGDAFWIDQAKFQQHCDWPFDDASCGTERSWGIDGKGGWCLSTDADDSFGSDRQDGPCHKCLEFRANDQKAVACR